MRLLVIGGTVFVGRAVVEEALARGHAVTYFHRGRHGGGMHPQAEELLGDRTGDLAPLRGREWDAVVDTCGFEPQYVAASAQLLSGAVGIYVFVSSGGVYRDWPMHPVPDEGAPVHQGPEAAYGPLKAACERAAEAAMPGRVLHVRAGVIVGPHENIGRLPWWLRRLAAGDRVLAPGPADAGLQLVDVRDLAAWMLDMALERRAGAFNAVAPPSSWSWGQLLETCREVTGRAAELTWVDGSRVAEAVEEPWEELPLWPAPLPEMASIYSIGAERALEAGLVTRPLPDTVADTWAWLSSPGARLAAWRQEVRARGLAPERERSLLASLATP